MDEMDFDAAVAGRAKKDVHGGRITQRRRMIRSGGAPRARARDRRRHPPRGRLPRAVRGTGGRGRRFHSRRSARERRLSGFRGDADQTGGRGGLSVAEKKTDALPTFPAAGCTALTLSS
jgi:hypothetical protein